MARAVFNSDDLRTSFYFIDDDRSMFENTEHRAVMEISVKDAAGEVVTIPFKVTRNAFLGSFHRRIYGEVLGTEDNIYRKIEIRLCSRDPQSDTINVFAEAPPIEMKLGNKTDESHQNG